MDQRRTEPGKKVKVPVWIEAPSGLLACKLSNLSLRGGELGVSIDLPLPDQFALRLTEDGKIRRGCEVMWRKEDRIRVSFFRLVETSRAAHV
jgi:hypothetical protein